MAASNTKSLPSIGFLTVVQDAERGYLGGYLVLNELARPLEFHCTAPVKPSRAQEILYGPALEDYLCGEQIGQALVKKSPLQPLAICTDFLPALALRPLLQMPMTLVAQRDRPVGPRLVALTLAEQSLAVPEAFADDRAELAARCESFAARFDLSEPFQRIREAIAETQLRGK